MLVNLVGLILLPRPQQKRDDEDTEHTAEVQDGQPEILVARVFLAEVKFECLAQAMQGVGARVHFTAFDALDGTRADFTEFSQALLRQSFLLAQFRNFESEIEVGSFFAPFEFETHYQERQVKITTSCSRHSHDICFLYTTPPFTLTQQTTHIRNTPEDLLV